MPHACPLPVLPCPTQSLFNPPLSLPCPSLVLALASLVTHLERICPLLLPSLKLCRESDSLRGRPLGLMFNWDPFSSPSAQQP